MIIDFGSLGRVRQYHPSKTIVFAGGCFDLVHEGHVSGMKFCKSLGDVLVVGVSSDERIKQRKGPTRPIRSELGRLMLVDALEVVDYSFIMPMSSETDTPTLRVIKQLKPDIFFDGADNRERWLDAILLIEGQGTKLVFNTSVRLDSTTDIIERAALPYLQQYNLQGV